MVARRDDAAGAPLRIHLFGGGYLVVWTAFSAVATAAQWAFTSTGVLSPMMEIQAPVVAGAMLVVAGLYQLTPLKRACLSACQSPAAFLVKHWRAGTRRRVPARDRPRLVLPGVLLGADAAALCRRRDEPHGDRRASPPSCWRRS